MSTKSQNLQIFITNCKKNFKNRTIYKLIKSKKYSDKAYVKKVFCLYKNPNLLLRRKKEAKIFNLGKYPKN